MLRLENIQKRFDDKVVVHPLDLHVARGQTTVLIGPSGCGKSTLLRMVVGLLRPDSGEIEFDGAALLSDLRAARLRMGYVVQGGGLFPHLTAAQNITLLARHLDWDRQRTESRLEELTALTAFPEDGLGRYPSRLSGGQCQRVALMRALFLDPELLLFDEPLGALDPMIRSELQTELRGIFESLGKTVLLVTHDLAEAAFFADTVVLLRDGRIEQRGPFGDLLERPASEFVERFVNAQRVDWSSGGES